MCHKEWAGGQEALPGLTQGLGQMAANVEKMTRMAGTEESWHGEENVTAVGASLQEWGENAGLGSKVRKAPLFIRSVEMVDDEEMIGSNGAASWSAL